MNRTPDEKRALIISDLLAGDGPVIIAKRHDVSHMTVRRIKEGLSSEQLLRIDTEKTRAIGDLVYEHLQTSLEATIHVVQQAQNEEWKFRQSAEGLATFYGVIADKSVRLLDALENARRAAEEQQQSEEPKQLN